MSGVIGFGMERKCDVCGKVFQMSEGWIYKRTSKAASKQQEKVFCSWGCLRKWEMQRGTKQNQRDKIIQAIKDGLTDKEVVILLNEDRARVAYWRKKLIREEEYERKASSEAGSEENRGT